MTLSVLNMIIHDVMGADLEKFTVRFRPINSMNDESNLSHSSMNNDYKLINFYTAYITVKTNIVSSIIWTGGSSFFHCMMTQR